MCAGYYTLAIYLTVVKWYIIIYHHHWPAQDQHGCHWSAWCSNHCNLHKGSVWKEIVCTLTQVAMIAASCTSMASVLIMSSSVVVVDRIACCCCILLHCTDAGPALCTLHPDLWRKHSTCAGGGIIIIIYSVLCTLSLRCYQSESTVQDKRIASLLLQKCNLEVSAWPFVQISFVLVILWLVTLFVHPLYILCM